MSKFEYVIVGDTEKKQRMPCICLWSIRGQDKRGA